MNDPLRPSRQASTPPALAPSTPNEARRNEQSRRSAQALRDQRKEAKRSSGIATEPRTSSGILDTDNIQLAGSTRRKRPSRSVSHSDKVTTNRDGRIVVEGEGESTVRPARKFTKYVDYNFSTMTDTKGGFLGAQDDSWNKSMGMGSGGGPDGQQAPTEKKPDHMTAAEWERLQLVRKLQRQKAGPYEPGLSVLGHEKEREKCCECGSLEIDFAWADVFQCAVCTPCKERFPGKYSLLTKTECKEDYLLTDSELGDEELLPHLLRPNPHKSHWHDMMLFLRVQVEQYAFTQKWGSAKALDAEFSRRQEDKKRRKEAKFKQKLLELKRKTRTDSLRRKGHTSGDGRHVHEWGRPVENKEGLTFRMCLSCGMEVEEMEF